VKRFAPVLSALLLITSTAWAETAWKAGAATVNITPAEPMYMAGYASRTHPSENTAQDLYAKALALDDGGGHQLLIITLDLIGVPRPLHDRLAAGLKATRQLPPEALLINASHTHCGPEFRVQGRPADEPETGRGQQAEAYAAKLEEQLLQLARDAFAHLEPAQLTYHHARCGFAMNRRLPVEGTFKNSPYPEGPVDQAVPVLRVTAGGEVRALLFGYACHNTTLSFYEWCGDYAGFAQQFLEEDHPGAVAMFMQGCAGDQNPYPRGKVEHVQFHGRALASAVEAAISATSTRVEGPLACAKAEVALEFAPQPDRAAFEERAKSADKLLAGHAQRMLARLAAEGALPTSYPYPVQVIRFDKSLTLVALAGETVVDYSLRLKREVTDTPLWIAGYSNDVMTYIPSKRVLEEGGYEGNGAMQYTRLPFPWAPSIEERIVGKVHELLRQTGG
jgi:hypothetical protein